MAPAERERELDVSRGSVPVRLCVGRAWTLAVRQRRHLARALRAGMRAGDDSAAVRRTGLAERSGPDRRLRRRVTRRNTPAVVVFYFGSVLFVGLRLRGVPFVGRKRSSFSRLKRERGPADRVVLRWPDGLPARAQMHGAGVAVALPGRALRAAAAGQNAVRVEESFGRKRTRKDAEQQRRRQKRSGEGLTYPECSLPGAPQKVEPPRDALRPCGRALIVFRMAHRGNCYAATRRSSSAPASQSTFVSSL